jgi:hypothetical protein
VSALIYTTPADQIVVQYDGEESMRDQFLRFHADNPHVYKELKRLSYKWVRSRPGEHLGISMLWEVMRWNMNLYTEGEPLKLNNNYRAFYARKLMDENPKLRGLFEIRRQRR